MSTIKQIDFLRRMAKGHGVLDLETLDEASKEALKKSGRSPDDLKRVAGVDRRVQGNEFTKLFALIDELDAAKGFVEELDGVRTPAGELYHALAAEVESNRSDPKYARPGATTAELIDEKLVYANALIEGAPKPDILLKVRGIDQFSLHPGDPEKGNKACFQAAVKEASDYLKSQKKRFTLDESSQVIQVAYGEDVFGRLQTDDSQAGLARAYVDAALEAGLPVVVGVSYEDQRYNHDRMTDHFVTIHQRGHDGAGRLFYGFKDPGAGGREGRFYIDNVTGNFFKEGDYAAPYVEHLDYEVTQIRTYRGFDPKLEVRPLPPLDPTQLTFELAARP